MSYNSIIKNCNFYINNRISSLNQLTSNEIYAELFFYESIRTNFQLSLKLYIISQNSSDIDVFEKNSNFVIIDKEIEINEEKQVFSFNLSSLNTNNIDISNVNLKACFVVLEKDTKLLYKDSYVKDIVINDLARYEPPVYEEYYTDATREYINDLISEISIINESLIGQNKIFGVDDYNFTVPDGLFIGDFCLLISPFRDLNNYDSAYNNSKNLKISFSDLYDFESGNLYLDFENEGFLSNNLLYNYLKDTLFTDRRLSRDVTLYFYFIDKSSYIIKNKLEWNKTITIASIQKLLSKISFIKNSNFIDSTLRISSLENDLYEINFDFLSDSAELDETILIRIKSEKSIDLFSDLELKDPVYKINNDYNDTSNIQIDLKSSSRKRLIFSSKDFSRRSNELLLQITTSSLIIIEERSVEKTFEIINSSYNSNSINSISPTLQQDSFVYNNQVINESINNAIKINTSATYDFVNDIFTNNALYIEISDEMFPKLNKALYGFSTDVGVLSQVFFVIDLKVKINDIQAATLKNYFVLSEELAVDNKINILSDYDDIELKEKSIVDRFLSGTINPRAEDNNTISLELKAKAILFKKDIITNINNESYDQSQISFLNRFLTTMIPDNSSPGSLIKIMNLKNIKKSDVYKNINAYFDEYYIERSFQI